MEKEEKIIAYLKQQLPPEEILAFEQELAENEELARALELQRFEQATIKYMMEQEMLNQMRSYRPAENTTRIRRIYPVIAIAASLTLLIGFFAINIFTHSNGKLVANTLEEVAPIYERSIRSSTDETTRFETDKIAALIERKEQEAKEAIDYFSSFETNHPLYPQAQFNLAHAYLLNGRNGRAIQQFQLILETSGFDQELKQASEYYLAIVLLADKQTSQATSILDDISKNNVHPYQSYAIQLLEKLNSFWRKLYQ